MIDETFFLNLFSYQILEALNETENATTTTTTTLPPPKIITIREPLEFQIEILDYADPSSEAQANSIKK